MVPSLIFFYYVQGFEEMINYDSKMIFVMLPGIKEFIKQRSAQDDSFRLVQAAIKVRALYFCARFIFLFRFLVWCYLLFEYCCN